jgi:hypothetical protein
VRFAVLAMVVTATCAGALGAVAVPGHTTAEPSGARHLPSICRGDEERWSACGVVAGYFHALNSSRFERACSLLGERLRVETGGESCSRRLALGHTGPVPWHIVDVRATTAGLGVVVDVGLSELGHWRTLRWLALLGQEHALLRIVETRRWS